MASNFQPSLSENGNKATVFQQLCLPVGVTLLVSGTRTLFPYAGCIAWDITSSTVCVGNGTAWASLT